MLVRDLNRLVLHAGKEVPQVLASVADYQPQPISFLIELFDLIKQLRLCRLDGAPVSIVVRFNLCQSRASCGDHVPQWPKPWRNITGFGV
jgi:hypothetical protein